MSAIRGTTHEGSARTAPDAVPKAGGTLRVAGTVGVDHLDTASGYLTQTWALTRNFARTLFNVRGAATLREAVALRADVAAAIPTVANSGLSPDGREYTIELRNGVLWNTDPPREVTAEDFIRGLKRLGNPAQPCGALAYYTDTIEGMAEFCAGYAAVDPGSVTALSKYQDSHPISGLQATAQKALRIVLKRPASDFLRLLSLQFAAAAPVEYGRYLPDSPELHRNLISNGPYRLTSGLPGEGYVLSRNPVWRQDTDPIRGQYADAIEVDLRFGSAAEVQDALEAGAADLSWDQRVPTVRIPLLLQERCASLYIADEAMASPYLAFNLNSPNNGGALREVRVRRAIEYAIDKAALAEVYGGPAIAAPLGQIIPPGGFGYRPFEPYVTAGSRGDPEKARRLLAESGYGSSLRLVFPYRTTSSYPDVAEMIKSDLARCGISVKLISDSDGSWYGKVLHTPAEADAGKWDIATPGWVPDWYGNNGRTSIVPLFDGRSRGANSPNCGGYQNGELGELIDRALEAASEEEAAERWHQADRLIMRDAPIVPLLVQKYPIYRSARARGNCYLPAIQAFEYSRVWLVSGNNLLPGY